MANEVTYIMVYHRQIVPEQFNVVLWQENCFPRWKNEGCLPREITGSGSKLSSAAARCGTSTFLIQSRELLFHMFTALNKGRLRPCLELCRLNAFRFRRVTLVHCLHYSKNICLALPENKQVIKKNPSIQIIAWYTKSSWLPKWYKSFPAVGISLWALLWCWEHLPRT